MGLYSAGSSEEEDEYQDTPERLCAHVSTNHGGRAPVLGLHFPDNQRFQTWLDRVEDSRAPQESGFVMPDESSAEAASEDGPFPDALGEYYLLCRPRKSPVLKRRKLGNGGSDWAAPPPPAVSCTAFVHVVENLNGSFFVRYCLEHCGHSPPSSSSSGILGNRTRRIGETRRRRVHLKRGSSSLVDSDGEDTNNHFQASPPNEVVMELDYVNSEELNNNEVGQALVREPGEEEEKEVPRTPIQSLDILKNALGELDYAQVERFIAERLDTTADKLKAITKVLAELAVDIRACDDALTQGQPLPAV